MPKERAILKCAFTQNGIPTSFSNAEVLKILNLNPEAKKIYDRLLAQRGGEARKANNTLRKALAGRDFLQEPGNLVLRKSFALQEIGSKFLQFSGNCRLDSFKANI